MRDGSWVGNDRGGPECLATEPELWAGATTMSALVGLGASALVVPPAEARSARFVGP